MCDVSLVELLRQHKVQDAGADDSQTPNRNILVPQCSYALLVRLQMRDNPMYSFQLRNTKATTPAQAVGGTYGDAHAVDQHAVLAAVKPTQRQKDRMLGAVLLYAAPAHLT